MYDFSISVERNLGEVEIVQVHWLYDHEVDPFDLTKICFLFCSDRLFTDKLVLTTVKHSAKRCCSFTFFECDCMWEFISSVFSRCYPMKKASNYISKTNLIIDYKNMVQIFAFLWLFGTFFLNLEKLFATILH